ncbi:MAG: pseudouridine synthase, partial [Clostridia bacterium]|nr:pseudouridine synthase [Clostridia bacterium]
MNGFLNILKPPGMTSAAVVAQVRRLTGEKRVGHAGTLDPEAAGVLPVMIGKAARLFDYLVDKEKEYVAECAFG